VEAWSRRARVGAERGVGLTRKPVFFMRLGFRVAEKEKFR